MTPDESPRIRRLPIEVANRIAAGEVVERPASVVKELVENALDAGARRVRVAVQDGGRWLEVSDDGHGMGREDAALAFERFATSKLSAEPDLWSLATLGFRGEALASIGSIAHASILTRRAEDEAGTEVRIEGGGPLVLRPAARAPGTTVRVSELFFNTPARRKFLRAPATELGHVHDTVQALALSRPEVEFELVANGRVALSSVGAAGDLQQVVGALLGASDWVPVAHRGGGGGLSGLAAPPAQWRSDKAWQWWFMNGRWVRHALLSKAVLEAAGPLPGGKQPAFVLSLDLDPSAVDVNVHPTKREVRLHQAQRVAWLVGQGVRAAWLAAGVIGEAQQWPGWRPGQADAPPLVGEGPAEPEGPWAGASSLPAAGHHGPGQHAAPEISIRQGAAAMAAFAPWTPPGSASEAGPSEDPASGEKDQALYPYEGGMPGVPEVAGARSPGGLRLLGVVHGDHLVAEHPEGLWLVQAQQAHAAVLLARWAQEGVQMAPLHAPMVLALRPDEVQGAAKVLPLLAGSGLDLEVMEGRSLWLRAAPPELPLHRVAELAEKLVRLAHSGADAKSLRRAMALEGAVRPGEWEGPWALSLLAAFEALGAPWHGPNGKPAARLIPLGEGRP